MTLLAIFCCLNLFDGEEFDIHRLSRILFVVNQDGALLADQHRFAERNTIANLGVRIVKIQDPKSRPRRPAVRATHCDESSLRWHAMSRSRQRVLPRWPQNRLALGNAFDFKGVVNLTGSAWYQSVVGQRWNVNAFVVPDFLKALNRQASYVRVVASLGGEPELPKFVIFRSSQRLAIDVWFFLGDRDGIKQNHHC